MNSFLRPMSTGEVLDRTFNLYRQNFRLFVAIGTVPALMWFVANAIVVLITNLQPRGGSFGPKAVAISGFTLFVGFLVYLCGVAIAHGAMSYAVSAIHLGRSTGFSESYRRLKGRYLRILNVVISVGIRILGVGLLVVLSPLILTLIPGMRGNESMAIIAVIVWLIALGVGVWLMLRLGASYALSVPACVLEDLKARKAIKRSAALAKGSAGRILTVYILFSLINLAFAFAVQLPFQIATTAVKTQVARVIVSLASTLGASIVSAIIGPLMTVALTLIYYDERVRKEAFDLSYMMEMLDAPATRPSDPSAPAASATTA